jgi:hypothetical protein
VIQVTSFDADGNLVVIDVPVVIVQPAPAPQLDLSTEPDGDVRISVDEPTRSLNYSADSWSLTIHTGADSGSVLGTNEQFTVAVASGSMATLTGAGFLPGTRVDIWMFSEPVLLGTFDVDEQGSVNAAVEIPATQIAPGEHTLQVQKVLGDGFIETTNLAVTIVEQPSELSTLKSSTLLTASGIALGALLALAVFIVWLVRRSRSEPNINS